MENKNRREKEEKIAQIQEKLGNAKNIVLATYQGLNVEEDTELRRKLRTENVEYKVYKNTLVTIAAKNLGMDDIVPYLQGPVSIAFDYEDETRPARLLNEFAKTHKKLELKAGMISGKVYDQDQIKQIANVPSKDVLIAKFLGSIKSPLSNFAYLLNAVKEKKESEA